MDALKSVNKRYTDQRERADARQVENSAGGYTFTVDDRTRLRRFLILGVDSPTYYSSAPKLARENGEFIIELAQRDHGLLYDQILDVSTSGAAHRQHATLFAYAIAVSYGTEAQRGRALGAFSRIVRTGTHLFLFAGYVEQFRGWGRALRSAVADWYTGKDPERLAYQVVKYRQREGWTHRDLLRLSHPKADEPVRANLFAQVAGKGREAGPHTRTYYNYEMVRRGSITPVEGVRNGLPWEALPTDSLTDVDVWIALLETGGIPLGALVRQLPRLTRLGVVDQRRKEIVARLSDRGEIRRSRLHPMAILTAQRTYASGQGQGQSWVPDRHIVDALDGAFYLSFENVVPTGKRTLVALDVSGSMGMQVGSAGLTAREVSAAMSLITLATEEDVDVVGFTGGRRMNPFGQAPTGSPLTSLTISPRQRLDDAIRSISRLPFGPTDCALPMLSALDKGLSYDSFIVYTDNETWAGRIHPHQALRRYRERTGIDAKLAVVGVTATDFTIADPSDPGMMDVVGFDPGAPAVMADFFRE